MVTRVFHLSVEHRGSAPLRVVAVFARQGIAIDSMRWDPPDQHGRQVVEIVAASTEGQADLLTRGLRRLPEVVSASGVADR